MKKAFIKRVLSYIIPLTLFAAMIVWLVLALNNASVSSDKRALSDLKTTIENNITMCYSIEGAYPENVDYLCKNYGLIFDKEKYIVHYEIFASNIRPTVTILERR